jgi:hypothetical protein
VSLSSGSFWLLDPEDRGSEILQNLDKNLPVDIIISRKTQEFTFPISERKCEFRNPSHLSVIKTACFDHKTQLTREIWIIIRNMLIYMVL